MLNLNLWKIITILVSLVVRVLNGANYPMECARNKQFQIFQNRIKSLPLRLIYSKKKRSVEYINFEIETVNLFDLYSSETENDDYWSRLGCSSDSQMNEQQGKTKQILSVLFVITIMCFSLNLSMDCAQARVNMCARLVMDPNVRLDVRMEKNLRGKSACN